jgi:hypothetical protein
VKAQAFSSGSVGGIFAPEPSSSRPQYDGESGSGRKDQL